MFRDSGFQFRVQVHRCQASRGTPRGSWVPWFGAHQWRRFSFHPFLMSLRVPSERGARIVSMSFASSEKNLGVEVTLYLIQKKRLTFQLRLGTSVALKRFRAMLGVSKSEMSGRCTAGPRTRPGPLAARRRRSRTCRGATLQDSRPAPAAPFSPPRSSGRQPRPRRPARKKARPERMLPLASTYIHSNASGSGFSRRTCCATAEPCTNGGVKLKKAV